MKALLDTHTLLWWLDGDEHLSWTARSWIETTEHRILVSAASAWEIAMRMLLRASMNA
ncbi:type II toxin-antitoxin system VapC family toxin [Nitrosomonas sp. Nm84]|uniref:type II toxin-antitoxin system VapC family toxin n=1 Tax=Nitrosomonas sp. Nm84 TaxID=200124 RepID=UPI0035CA3B4F